MRTAKIHKASGAIVAVRSGDALPAIDESVYRYLDCDLDPATYYHDGQDYAERSVVADVTIHALIGSTIDLPVPPSAYVASPLGVIAQTRQVTVADGLSVYRLVGRYSGSVMVEGSSIEAAKAERWEAIKRARDEEERAGCETPKGRADTSPDSQRKVGGAVQMAMLAQAAGQPFRIGWTMASNETVEHDAAAMIQLGLAVGRHVQACHDTGAALRAQINAAKTLDEVEAVRWTQS